MFEITQKFVHETGFEITPFFMEGTGFVFLPKELEAQLGYENFAQTIFHSDSFKEGIEYIILRESNLLEFKELLNLSNSITSVLKEDFKHAPSLILLTESGLYTAMILSRKPNSENFRRWITCEVLPSIREKGYYLQENQGDRKLSTKKDAITLSNDSGGFIKKIVDNLSIQIARFSESTENRLNQIEAVLAECRQNQDLFAGWKGIKTLVEEASVIPK